LPTTTSTSAPDSSSSQPSNVVAEPALRAAVLKAAPGANLNRATVLGEGWGCLAYRVPAPGGDLALRVPKPGSWWAAPDLEREARLLPALAAYGLPVPRGARLLRGPDGAVLGALQSVIEGAAATKLPRSLAQRVAYADDLGRLFARLHAFPLDRARSLRAREPHMWTEHYAPLVDYALPQLPPASRRWLETRVATFLAAGGVDATTLSLIHADISGTHLIVDARWRLAGVIDWGDAMIGDIALDFAGLLNHYPWRFMERVIERYEAHGGAPDDDLPRRARFYIDVAPVFLVRYGHMFNGGQDRSDGLRQFAARAGAANRTARAVRVGAATRTSRAAS
jgi:aminoglycoside 2''-phosphotransferase